MNSKNNRKTVLLLMAVVLMMVFGVGGTIAYLLDKTDAVVNTFTPTEVKITVHEQFDNTVKKDVTITNTGSVDAYIRAMVLVSWKNDKGVILPVNSADYAISWTKNGWVGEHTDGFYYYKTPVAAGGTTGTLFTECKLEDGVEAPADGFKLHVEILAQAVQAEPSMVVQKTWGVQPETLT